MTVVLLDPATAATLAQVLPLLLISIMVELRRTRLHLRGRRHGRNRVLLGLFFFVFGIVETVLVLSIDKQLLPLRWADVVAALIIFGLLGGLFALSLMEPRNDDEP
ncbi:hypothetical protein BH11ACT4_BH11ACT4_07720 [soil metagenome]